MTALRMRARDVLSEDELVTVRERVTWKGIALIVHAWALIAGAIALVAWGPNPLTYLLAVGIIGSRQLGLAILMHDGAHGCLSANENTNLALSQWFCAYPVFAETRAYRRYHLQHHARTQQEDDPDLILSAPFPITAASSFAISPVRPAISSARRNCSMRWVRRIGRLGSAPHISGKSSGRNASSTRSCSLVSRRPVSGGPIRCSGWCHS
jgi:hypothetical protein